MFFVISNQFGSFYGNSVEWVVNERVHDCHGFFGDSGFWVNLFQNFVDIDSEGFNSSFMSFFLFDFFLKNILQNPVMQKRNRLKYLTIFKWILIFQEIHLKLTSRDVSKKFTSRPSFIERALSELCTTLPECGKWKAGSPDDPDKRHAAAFFFAEWSLVSSLCC